MVRSLGTRSLTVVPASSVHGLGGWHLDGAKSSLATCQRQTNRFQVFHRSLRSFCKSVYLVTGEERDDLTALADMLVATKRQLGRAAAELRPRSRGTSDVEAQLEKLRLTRRRLAREVTACVIQL